MGEIIIEETNHRAFAMTMANLFMLIASVSISIYGMAKERMVYFIPGLIAVIIFFIGFLVSISKAMKVKKLLTITMDGIIDSSSLGGFGFIPFDAIKEFRIVNQYRTRVLAVILKDQDKFLSGLPSMKRRQAKRNLIMDLPPVIIQADLAKDMEPEDILSLLQKRLSDNSRLYE